MAEVASAFVSLVPSARGFGRRMDAQIGPDLDKSGKTGGKRFGGAFSGAFKGLVGPALGLAAAAGVTSLIKGSIAEAREAQKVGALTASIIKSTGGAAKLSARDIALYSTSLSNKTGVDDEAIQSGANLLLTFKNIKEAGIGVNAIFSRALTAASDLSAAGFGDLASTSKQLGKALNDPVKGISALGRAGVTFTDAQKKQIKGFVKANDLLSAQKIILKEVESQVGGAAAASATSGEKMSVAFGNLKEQIGTALLPVIDKLAVLMTTKVVPALSQFIAFLQKNPQIVIAVVAAVAALAAVFVVAFVAANAIAFAIAAVVAGIVYAYLHFETFRNIVNAVFKFVVAYVRVQVTVLIAVLRGIWAAILAVIGFFKSLYTGVRDAIEKVKAKIGEIKDKVTGAFSGAKDWLVNAGKKIIQGLIDGITSKFGAVKNKLGDLTGKLTSWKGPASLDKVILKASGAMVIDGFISGLESRYPRVESTLGGLTSGLPSSVSAPRVDSSVSAFGGAASSGDTMTRLHPDDIDALIQGILAGAHTLDVRRDSATDMGLRFG